MRPIGRRTFVAAALIFTRAMSAQVAIPLDAAHWTATDSLRFTTRDGRAALYIDRGVALATGVALREGTIEYDMLTPKGSNFMGAAFHATSHTNSEVVFFRPGSGNTIEAMQYGPALNGLAVAWQVWHGEGANASVPLAFDRWVHVKIDIAGTTAKVFVDRDTAPALVVPRLAGVEGSQLGVWTGHFGRGAYYANITYAVRPESPPVAPPPMPPGTIVDWELSNAVDAPTLRPGTLPKLDTFTWQKVRAEWEGFVLVNRYRSAPNSTIPVDPTTGRPLVDSILGNRVAGSKVVLARTTITSDRAVTRKLRIGYSDGAVVYLNGAPLFAGMNPFTLRCCDAGASAMDRIGTTVYLPLRAGRNELVFAVTEYTGGWAYWARLEP